MGRGNLIDDGRGGASATHRRSTHIEQFQFWEVVRSYEWLSSMGYLPYAAANTELLCAILQCRRTDCSRLRAPSQLALLVFDVPEAFQALPDVLRRKLGGLELALGAVATTEHASSNPERIAAPVGEGSESGPRLL